MAPHQLGSFLGVLDHSATGVRQQFQQDQRRRRHQPLHHDLYQRASLHRVERSNVDVDGQRYVQQHRVDESGDEAAVRLAEQVG